MDLRTVLELLEGEVITRAVDLNQEVALGGAADLMSDVLTYARPDSVLLTGLVHPQVVRTAEMIGILAVVFVRGKRPLPETLALAEEIGVSLLATRYTLYDACGRLYAAGLSGPGLCDTYPAQDE